MIKYNITLSAGGDYSQTFKFITRKVSRIESETGELVEKVVDTPRDFQDSTITARIVRRFGDSATLATFQGSGNSLGEITLTLNAAQLPSAPSGGSREVNLGYYDVYVVSGSSRERVLEGEVILSKSATF